VKYVTVRTLDSDEERRIVIDLTPWRCTHEHLSFDVPIDGPWVARCAVCGTMFTQRNLVAEVRRDQSTG
jgi:hypothetical protein